MSGIYKQHTIYKSGLSESEIYALLNERESITFKMLPKYQNLITDIGNTTFVQKSIKAVYSCAWIVFNNSFTPTYSNDDPAGTNYWPCIAESEETLFDLDINVSGLDGLAMNEITKDLSKISYQIKNGKLYLLLNSQTPMGSYVNNIFSMTFLY